MDNKLPFLEDLDTSATRPRYKWLKSHLMTQVSEGRIKPGESLPSEQRLATMHGIARTTVRRALAELETEGIVRRVERQGTFVEESALGTLQQSEETLALVIPQIRTGFYPSLLQSFTKAAGEIHHQAIVCGTSRNVEKQGNIILQLLDRRVGGVAMVPASFPDTPSYQVRQLQVRGVPVVFCHRRVEGVRAPLLSIPFEKVGRVAGKAFLSHGHRRVAFLATASSKVTDMYVRNLREVMRGGGGELPEELVWHYPSELMFLDEIEDEGPILESLRRMFDRPDPPTGIMCSFDSLAEVVYMQLGRLGLKAPQDVSLMGFGGTWRNGAVNRQLTSVVVDESEIARRAVELLHEMRNGRRPIDDEEEITMPLSISNGRTLGPAPPAPRAIN